MKALKMWEAGYTGSLAELFLPAHRDQAAQHTPLANLEVIIPQLGSQPPRSKLHELLLELAQESHLFNCAPISLISHPHTSSCSKSQNCPLWVSKAFYAPPL